MSDFGEVTERQLKIGVIKLAISIAILMLVGTFLISLLIPSTLGISSISIQSIIFAFAFSILASGVRSFLSIIDWFESRRLKQKITNG